MDTEPLMAQALAEAIGATKRQVQIWTDAGAIRCIEGTDRQGTGRQRLYDPQEVPIAALIAKMAQLKAPIGTLLLGAHQIRTHLDGGFPPELHVKQSPAWFRRAVRGEISSYLVLSPDFEPGRLSFSWCNQKAVDEFVEFGKCMLIVNVKRTVSNVKRTMAE